MEKIMEHTPYTAPYSIHPVNGMIVDANGKCVMLCLSSAYGKARHKILQSGWW